MQEKHNFVVRTVDGVFRSGHETLEQAEAAAKDANERAEQMGLKVRYRVPGA